MHFIDTTRTFTVSDVDVCPSMAADRRWQCCGAWCEKPRGRRGANPGFLGRAIDDFLLLCFIIFTDQNMYKAPRLAGGSDSRVESRTFIEQISFY